MEVTEMTNSGPAKTSLECLKPGQSREVVQPACFNELGVSLVTKSQCCSASVTGQAAPDRGIMKRNIIFIATAALFALALAVGGAGGNFPLLEMVLDLAALGVAAVPVWKPGPEG